MVRAASCLACWAAWAYGNITSEAPARAVIKAYPEFRFPEPRPSGGANQQEGPGPREARSQSRLTQESNAGHSGAFLDRPGIEIALKILPLWALRSPTWAAFTWRPSSLGSHISGSMALSVADCGP